MGTFAIGKVPAFGLVKDTLIVGASVATLIENSKKLHDPAAKAKLAQSEVKLNKWKMISTAFDGSTLDPVKGHEQVKKLDFFSKKLSADYHYRIQKKIAEGQESDAKVATWKKYQKWIDNRNFAKYVKKKQETLENELHK